MKSTTSVHAAIYQLFAAFVSMTTLTWMPAVADEQSSSSQTQAVARIFGDDVLSDNVAAQHAISAESEAAENFDRLRKWVLPSDTHQSWRLSAGFQNGQLVSPAIDLVVAATQTGQLQALEAAVASSPVAGPFERRCQLALLSVVGFAAKDTVAAEEHINELFAAYDASWTTHAEQIPETLAVLNAARQPQQDHMLTDPVSRMVRGFMLEDDRNTWQLKLWEVFSTHKTADYRPDEELQSASILRQWIPISRVTAQTHGSGNPAARWGYNNGRVDVQASHSRDYLYFRSPLRGDFVVEGDVTSFGFRGSHLAYADTEIIPVYNLQEYALCQFRSQEARFDLAPQAWGPRDWFRCRLEITDGVATAAFNGHRYPSLRLDAHPDPWLSICSPVRFNGGARNLRITGDAMVPEMISLARSERLSGWLAYYEDEPVYHSDAGVIPETEYSKTEEEPGEASAPITASVWNFDSESPTGGIVGRREPDLAVGCYNERLLRYHRPMLEDGVIELDFFYHEGQVESHPAIGRTVFVLQPDGVKIHQLTDGRFERTDLRPDNLQQLNNETSEPLGFHQNAWNRLRLTLTGDKLQLELNGTTVASYQLTADDNRSFGLFYFSDQTELRVRNIQWTGDWPRQIPGIRQQEMAGKTTEDIDATLPELTDAFDYDFATSGLSSMAVQAEAETEGKDFTQTEDGLYAECRGVGRYQDATIHLKFSLAGDFDISARFEGLVTECFEGDSSMISVRIAFADDLNTRCSLRRCRQKEGRTPLKQIIRCYHEFDQQLENKERHTRRLTFAQDTCEATDGTLRLARRGDQLFFLLAEGRSEYFRVVGVRPVTTDDVELGGLELMTQLHSQSEDAVTSVVWKSLSVRATKIVHPATSNITTTPLAQLNQDRKLYAAVVDFNFPQMQTGVETLTLWGNTESIRHTSDGVRFTSLGTEDWTSTGACPQMVLQGDFDVSNAFEVEKIVPRQPKGESSVYMQAIFHDIRRTTFSMILDDGELKCRVKIRDDNGRTQTEYLNRELVENVKSVRFARRGDVMHALVTAGTPATERVFAAGKINEPAASSPARFTFMVQTRGIGRETHCLWKQLSVHQSAPPMFVPAQRPGPPGGA